MQIAVLVLSPEIVLEIRPAREISLLVEEQKHTISHVTSMVQINSLQIDVTDKRSTPK